MKYLFFFSLLVILFFRMSYINGQDIKGIKTNYQWQNKIEDLEKRQNALLDSITLLNQKIEVIFFSYSPKFEL